MLSSLCQVKQRPPCRCQNVVVEVDPDLVWKALVDKMKLNDDFTVPVDTSYADAEWVTSPLAGVERHMLDRIGDEKARATTIVRYAKDSHFSTHTHDEGEEFVVLEGTFSDSSGDFSPGVYVRNPPGSAHAPWSVDGTIIFVKLRQFDPGDTARIVIDPGTAEWHAAKAPGVSTLHLHTFADETVSMARFAPGAVLRDQTYAGGLELLVIDGEIALDGISHHRWDWMRRPASTKLDLASSDGGTIYLKTGHLPS